MGKLVSAAGGRLGVQRDLRGRCLHTKGGEEAGRGWSAGVKPRGEEEVRCGRGRKKVGVRPAAQTKLLLGG